MRRRRAARNEGVMPTINPQANPVIPDESDFIARWSRQPGHVSWSMFAKCTESLLKSIGGILKEEYAKRDVRLDELVVLHRALAERLSALETRGDAGVWDETKSYKRFSGVSFDGGFWLAQRDVARGEKPGVTSAWRLAVRRGRQGKEGQPGKDAI